MRMDLKRDLLGTVEWIQLAQDRDWWGTLENAVKNLRVLTPNNYLI
jgi:hypothetical protein